LIKPESSVTECHIATEFDFHHFGINGEEDYGWGCCYRGLQNVLSNFKYRGIENKVPSIIEIQTRLSAIDNMPRSGFIGTNKWIEPPNCNMYLTSLGYASEYITCIPDNNRVDIEKKIMESFLNSQNTNHY